MGEEGQIYGRRTATHKDRNLECLENKSTFLLYFSSFYKTFWVNCECEHKKKI